MLYSHHMMITTQQYLDSLAKDFAIIRHLASKLKAEDLEYKPTPKQRSVMELLQYMSFAFGAMAESVTTGDSSIWGARSKAAEALTLADFDATMATQEMSFHALFKSLSAEQMAEEVDFYGVSIRAVHFLNVLKMATAYKMQLFLYMKSIGYHHLNTMNLWAGADSEMAG